MKYHLKNMNSFFSLCIHPEILSWFRPGPGMASTCLEWKVKQDVVLVELTVYCKVIFWIHDIPDEGQVGFNVAFQVKARLRKFFNFTP